MSENKERFLWLTKGQFIGALGFICLAGIALALSGLFYSIGANRATSEHLCANQHSLVEMQKLFLKEHADLRRAMASVGVTSHSDPELLIELGALIEAAECSP